MHLDIGFKPLPRRLVWGRYPRWQLEQRHERRHVQRQSEQRAVEREQRHRGALCLGSGGDGDLGGTMREGS